MAHFIALLLLLLAPFAALAADVALIGVIGDKAAVFALDGGEPKAVKVGQTWNGINVVSVEREQATVEIEGKQRVLRIGQHHRSAATPAAGGRTKVTLAADGRGMFHAEGAINGLPVRFMVDTGATITALPAADARRLGIDVSKGQPVLMRTANGTARGRQVKLDVVTVGGVTLYGVDAVVMDGDGLAFPLLGMSFLNRMDMKREGSVMTLTKRY